MSEAEMMVSLHASCKVQELLFFPSSFLSLLKVAGTVLGRKRRLKGTIFNN